MSAEPPLGERFSQVYLERGTPTQDSARARHRIGSALANIEYELRKDLAFRINADLGVPCSYQDLRHFAQTCELRDFLDSITITFRVLRESGNRWWSDFASGVLREENLGYELDARAGVRYFADEEFERSRTAVIAGLGVVRYTAARQAFEEAHTAMAGAPPDTLTAVRRSFDAVENVFKMMTGEPRLGSSEIGKKLKPKLGALSGRSADASKLLADSFSAWVNACHQYRHAEGEPEPSPPPIDLALALISSAATYLRWLVGMDSAAASP